VVIHSPQAAFAPSEKGVHGGVVIWDRPGGILADPEPR
jgi:hypothetical protein